MRSMRRGDFTVDLGRKELYSRIPEIDTLWDGILGADFRSYPHRIGSLHGGAIIEMSSAFRGRRRGMTTAQLATGALDLARAWARSGVRQPSNYEEYWYQRTGETFARMMAQGYWEKFRGQKWSDMPVPRFDSDGRALKPRRFGALGHGLKLAAKGGQASQARWRHPAYGTGQICSLLAEDLVRHGGEIRFDTEVVSLEMTDGAVSSVTALKEGQLTRSTVANVISSLQVEALELLLWKQWRKKRNFPGQRTVFLVYVFLDETPRFPHAWLEVNDVALNCGRITNYASFGGKMVPEGKTALCVEFFVDASDERTAWSEERWTRCAIAECARNALIDPTRIADTMFVRLERCNAAASWRDAQESRRKKVLDEILPIKNLYHVYRPGTDWASFAGLSAARAIVSGQRLSFEQTADPTKSYLEQQGTAVSSA